MRRSKLFSLFFLLTAVLLIVACGNNSIEREGEARTPSVSRSQRDKFYKDVVQEFEKNGFVNIKTEALGNLITGWLKTEGQVRSVTVDGNERYASNRWYPNDVEVIIKYHSFPIENESSEEVSEVAMEPVTKDDSYRTNSLERVQENGYKEATNEGLYKVGDRSREIYDEATGKLAIDVYNELESIGYKVSFTHEITKMDFTESVQHESNPESEFYIPWIITGLDSYNATSKTASFHINTQEMINESQRRTATKKALEAKLSPSNAWGAVDYYGKRKFPNGFKLRIATRMLAETAVDENTWFLKAGCQVRNEYGTWINLVCEARVSGTTASPNVISFNVYSP